MECNQKAFGGGPFAPAPAALPPWALVSLPPSPSPSQLNPAALCPTFLPDSALRNAKASVPMKLLVSKHPLLPPLPPCVSDGFGLHARPGAVPALGLTHTYPAALTLRG